MFRAIARFVPNAEGGESIRRVVDRGPVNSPGSFCGRDGQVPFPHDSRLPDVNDFVVHLVIARRQGDLFAPVDRDLEGLVLLPIVRFGVFSPWIALDDVEIGRRVGLVIVRRATATVHQTAPIDRLLLSVIELGAAMRPSLVGEIDLDGKKIQPCWNRMFDVDRGLHGDEVIRDVWKVQVRQLAFLAIDDGYFRCFGPSLWPREDLADKAKGRSREEQGKDSGLRSGGGHEYDEGGFRGRTSGSENRRTPELSDSRNVARKLPL